MKSQINKFRFTLIELLVVVGIIAMLIAILLPALSSAKETAKQVACLANQKQIGLLLSLYQIDNRQRIPEAVSTIDSENKYYYSRFIDGLPGGADGAVDDSYYEGDAYGKGGVFRCTKNKYSADLTNIYGMYDIRQNDDLKFMEEWRPDSNNKFCSFKMMSMPEPSQFMLLGCSLQSNLESKSFSWQGVYKFRRTTVRSNSNANGNWGLWMIHFNMCNGLFADGHATQMDMHKLFTTRNGYKDGSSTNGIRAWKMKDGTHMVY